MNQIEVQKLVEAILQNCDEICEIVLVVNKERECHIVPGGKGRVLT